MIPLGNVNLNELFSDGANVSFVSNPSSQSQQQNNNTFVDNNNNANKKKENFNKLPSKQVTQKVYNEFNVKDFYKTDDNFDKTDYDALENELILNNEIADKAMAVANNDSAYNKKSTNKGVENQMFSLVLSTNGTIMNLKGKKRSSSRNGSRKNNTYNNFSNTTNNNNKKLEIEDSKVLYNSQMVNEISLGNQQHHQLNKRDSMYEYGSRNMPTHSNSNKNNGNLDKNKNDKETTDELYKKINYQNQMLELLSKTSEKLFNTLSATYEQFPASFIDTTNFKPLEFFTNNGDIGSSLLDIDFDKEQKEELKLTVIEREMELLRTHKNTNAFNICITQPIMDIIKMKKENQEISIIKRFEQVPIILSQIVEETNARNQDIDKLKSAVSHLISNIEKEKDDKTKILNDNEIKLNAKKSEIEAKNIEMFMMIGEVNEKKAELESNKKKIEELNKEIERLNQELIIMKKKLDEKTDHFMKVSNEVSTLKKENINLLTELDEIKKELQINKENEQKPIDCLKKVLCEKTEAITYIQQLENNNADILKKNLQMEDKIKYFENEIKIKDQSLDSLSEELLKIREELLEKDKEIKRINEDLIKKDYENTQQTKDILLKKETEIALKEKDNEILEKKVTDLNEINKIKESKIAEKDQELIVAAKKEASLSIELKSLRNDVQQSKNKIEDLSVRLKEKEDENKLIKEQYEEELYKANEEIRDLKQQLNGYNSKNINCNYNKNEKNNSEISANIQSNEIDNDLVVLREIKHIDTSISNSKVNNNETPDSPLVGIYVPTKFNKFKKSIQRPAIAISDDNEFLSENNNESEDESERHNVITPKRKMNNIFIGSDEELKEDDNIHYNNDLNDDKNNNRVNHDNDKLQISDQQIEDYNEEFNVTVTDIEDDLIQQEQINLNNQETVNNNDSNNDLMAPEVDITTDDKSPDVNDTYQYNDMMLTVDSGNDLDEKFEIAAKKMRSRSISLRSDDSKFYEDFSSRVEFIKDLTTRAISDDFTEEELKEKMDQYKKMVSNKYRSSQQLDDFDDYYKHSYKIDQNENNEINDDNGKKKKNVLEEKRKKRCQDAADLKNQLLMIVETQLGIKTSEYKTETNELNFDDIIASLQ